ncbi:MAG: hypothetical protein AB7P23_13990 [Amphiplicatus sp.]
MAGIPRIPRIPAADMMLLIDRLGAERRRGAAKVGASAGLVAFVAAAGAAARADLSLEASEEAADGYLVAATPDDVLALANICASPAGAVGAEIDHVLHERALAASFDADDFGCRLASRLVSPFGGEAAHDHAAAETPGDRHDHAAPAAPAPQTHAAHDAHAGHAGRHAAASDIPSAHAVHDVPSAHSGRDDDGPPVSVERQARGHEASHDAPPSSAHAPSAPIHGDHAVAGAPSSAGPDLQAALAWLGESSAPAPAAPPHGHALIAEAPPAELLPPAAPEI